MWYSIYNKRRPVFSTLVITTLCWLLWNRRHLSQMYRNSGPITHIHVWKVKAMLQARNWRFQKWSWKSYIAYLVPFPSILVGMLLLFLKISRRKVSVSGWKDQRVFMLSIKEMTVLIYSYVPNVLVAPLIAARISAADALLHIVTMAMNFTH